MTSPVPRTLRRIIERDLAHELARIQAAAGPAWTWLVAHHDTGHPHSDRPGGNGTEGDGNPLDYHDPAGDAATSWARTQHHALDHYLHHVHNLLADIAQRLVAIAQIDPPDSRTLRCTGGHGLPGNVEWGDPTCQNLAVSRLSGLCDGCRMRRARWAKRVAA